LDALADGETGHVQADQRGVTAVKRVLFILAVALGVAAPAYADDVYSLLDFNSAVDALYAVDPTIDPPPNDPGRDFAVGGFTGAEDNNKIGFSGSSGPMGEDPVGKMSETIPGVFQARYRVTCLAVLGLDAALGLVATHAAANDVAKGDEFILAVRDSRLPGGAMDEWAFFRASANDCATYVHFAEFTIERGNILVHDALP
jgi:hypothetical protein